MKLILTEKPSVAQDFASALDARKRYNYYTTEDYIITFCVGHLLRLAEPEEYDSELKNWSYDGLPIIPKSFKHYPISNTKDQLGIVKNLLGLEDIEEVILATDAGREGELIGREVLNWCHYDLKKVKRFWSSEALNKEVVLKGLNDLKNSQSFDTLYESGYFRAVSDWLVGMNFSRFFSLTLNDVFSVGRVQTSILNLLCQRQTEINNFKSEPYYQMEVTFKKDDKEFKALLFHDNKDRFSSRSDMLSFVNKVSDADSGIVQNVDIQEKRKKPPALLNLTALQRQANVALGFSANKTLQIAQSLYEKHKCLSYPRTPSRVMAESNVGLVKEKIDLLKEIYPGLFKGILSGLVDEKNKHVFNAKKLEDHHALIILDKLPDNASEDEKIIYDLVLRSFAAVFHPELVYNSQSAVIMVETCEFRCSGRVEISSGWTAVYKESNEDEKEHPSLPDLEVGESVSLMNSEILEKMTQPSKNFTEASLLSAMENPTRFCKTEIKFKKELGIGTQATRASIIEILLGRHYIERQAKKLIPTEKGFHLINSINEFINLKKFIQVDETARWEEELNDNPKSFYENINSFVTSQISILIDQKEKLSAFVKEEPDIGLCPLCGGKLRVNSKSFYCSNWKEKGCNFTIWKNFRGSTISPSLLGKLLEGKTSERTFKTKDGKPYKAKVKLEKDAEKGCSLVLVK